MNHEKGFLKDERGISPAVGVMLMIVITVMLATAVFVAVLGIQMPTALPMAAIVPEPDLNTIQMPDLIITHRGGDRLDSGSWWISVVPVGVPPLFVQSSTDFQAGDRILTLIDTSVAGEYTVTNASITTAGTPKYLNYGKYHVQIVLKPYNSLIVNDVVEVR